MSMISIRFYGELNVYLPVALQQPLFQYELKQGVTVETLLDSLSIPSTKIDLILVNDEPVGFGYQLHSGDRISFYPIFCSIDISPLNLINRGLIQ